MTLSHQQFDKYIRIDTHIDIFMYTPYVYTHSVVIFMTINGITNLQ